MIEELVKWYEAERLTPEIRPSKLREFIAELTQSYPCITQLEDADLANGVWADGPIENNIGRNLIALSMIRLDLKVLQEAARLARQYDLNLFIPSENEIIWPD